ncbi:MAG: 50S ribosomal protein L28 [Deltaproteobacteria bacterium]|nr:50S ribosomal protein L28 [Deltaproteobacteria bacterium]
MAKCELTGKRRLKGHNVSHANNKTRKWQHPNVQNKRIWVEELGRFVRLSLSTRAIRTITRVGLVTYARNKGIDLASLVD